MPSYNDMLLPGGYVLPDDFDPDDFSDNFDDDKIWAAGNSPSTEEEDE